MHTNIKAIAMFIAICPLSFTTAHASTESNALDKMTNIQLAHNGGYGGQHFGWGSGWSHPHHYRWKTQRICRNRCEDAIHFRHCFRNCLLDRAYGHF